MVRLQGVRLEWVPTLGRPICICALSIRIHCHKVDNPLTRDQGAEDHS